MCLHFTVQSVCLPFCVRTESRLNSVGHWDFHPYKTPFCCPSLSNVLSCICHFYRRSWGGSDWGRRDLDCRWYLSHLRPLVQWILLKQQLVLFLHHILRCLWEKEVCSVTQVTCWLAYLLLMVKLRWVLSSPRTWVEFPHRSPVRMGSVFAHDDNFF